MHTHQVQQKLRSELNKNIEMKEELCEPCNYGKLHRRSLGTRHKTNRPDELMSADVVRMLLGIQGIL